jgi:hypothetical protein
MFVVAADSADKWTKQNRAETDNIEDGVAEYFE